MSALTRLEPWSRSPWKELEEMEKRLSTIFGRPSIGSNGEHKEAISVAEWSPLVDISEDDKEYVVKAEIPEMKKEDIKINVHDDVLTLLRWSPLVESSSRIPPHTCLQFSHVSPDFESPQNHPLVDFSHDADAACGLPLSLLGHLGLSTNI